MEESVVRSSGSATSRAQQWRCSNPADKARKHPGGGAFRMLHRTGAPCNSFGVLLLIPRSLLAVSCLSLGSY